MVNTAADYNLDGNLYDIPNQPAFGCSVSNSRSAFKNGLFTAFDFLGTEGNMPRNCYRNSGMVNVDASLAKNTHLPWFGEAGNLQLRFDFLTSSTMPTSGRSTEIWLTLHSAE